MELFVYLRSFQTFLCIQACKSNAGIKKHAQSYNQSNMIGTVPGLCFYFVFCYVTCAFLLWRTNWCTPESNNHCLYLSLGSSDCFHSSVPLYTMLFLCGPWGFSLRTLVVSCEFWRTKTTLFFFLVRLVIF